MGDVRSSGDLESDEGELGSSPTFCRASYFPIIRMCSRRSNQASSQATCPAAPRDSDHSGTMTAEGRSIDRRAVRDRNGRILFYYAPLPRRGPVAGQSVGCRVSLCKSRSAGEILSTSRTSAPAVNNSRFAVPLQMRRRQLDDIRRRLAAVDLDDDDDQDSWRCRQSSDEAESETGTCRGSRLDDHVKCNRARSIDNGVDEDELDRHRKHRHQRLQQAVGSLANSADIGTGVRRGGSVESDCTSRSDRDGSTDGSASASTDTDPDHTCIPVSVV